MGLPFRAGQSSSSQCTASAWLPKVCTARLRILSSTDLVCGPVFCTDKKVGTAKRKASWFSVIKDGVAVGITVARYPPHRSVRAAFPHTAPTLDEWRQSGHSDMDA